MKPSERIADEHLDREWTNKGRIETRKDVLATRIYAIEKYLDEQHAARERAE